VALLIDAVYELFGFLPRPRIDMAQELPRVEAPLRVRLGGFLTGCDGTLFIVITSLRRCLNCRDSRKASQAVE